MYPIKNGFFIKDCDLYFLWRRVIIFLNCNRFPTKGTFNIMRVKSTFAQKEYKLPWAANDTDWKGIYFQLPELKSSILCQTATTLNTTYHIPSIYASSSITASPSFWKKEKKKKKFINQKNVIWTFAPFWTFAQAHTAVGNM